MAERPIPAEIVTLSFEDALAELETIVRQLEAGQGKLDENISAYERGALLRAHCETKLREAQARVEMISRAADGSVAVKPATFE
jgi:exodeoxyribonuclease VII small subunit